MTEISASCGSPSQLWLPQAERARDQVDQAEVGRQHQRAPEQADHHRREHDRQNRRDAQHALPLRYLQHQQRQRQADDHLQHHRAGGVDQREPQRIPEARVAAHLGVVVQPGEARQPRHAEVDALHAVPRQVDQRHGGGEQQHAAAPAPAARTRSAAPGARASPARPRPAAGAVIEIAMRGLSPSGSAGCGPAPRPALPSASSARPARTGSRWPWCRRWPATAARADAIRRRCPAPATPARPG